MQGAAQHLLVVAWLLRQSGGTRRRPLWHRKLILIAHRDSSVPSRCDLSCDRSPPPTADGAVMLDQPANSRLRSHARPVRPRLRPLYDFEPRQRFLSRLDRAQGAPTGLEVNWTDGLELVTE